jgi:glycosyltransferase involved in cell wall biosynthesis
VKSLQESIPELKDLRIAIVHYWLVNHGGGERVLDILCELLPQADVFVGVADPATLSAQIRSRHLQTSFLQSIPGSVRWYRHFLPLYPMALENLDLSSYDLVVSQESGPAKGVLTRPDTLHICYCNSPMRYIWDMYGPYRASMGTITRAMFSTTAHYMRMWDVISASRVDHFIANSSFIAKRIRKYYRRESTVIHPPVSVPAGYRPHDADDYYLIVGRLTDYKRVDIAVDAFNEGGWTLHVVGDGPLYSALRRRARPNIKFLGRLSDDEIHQQYARCRALIFLAEEDFGIVPVEAQAFGRPVIAYGSGGAVDTVVPFQRDVTPAEFATGILFRPQSPAGLFSAIREFEQQEAKFRPEFIRSHAMRFRPEEFKRSMSEYIVACLAEHRSGRQPTARVEAALPV